MHWRIKLDFWYILEMSGSMNRNVFIIESYFGVIRWETVLIVPITMCYPLKTIKNKNRFNIHNVLGFQPFQPPYLLYPWNNFRFFIIILHHYFYFCKITLMVFSAYSSYLFPLTHLQTYYASDWSRSTASGD